MSGRVVAFDFDGVFHKHVDPPNTPQDIIEKAKEKVLPDGRRRPGKQKTLSGRDISIESDDKPTEWFMKNIKLLKDYHGKGYTIYIVTARLSKNNSKEKIFEWIQSQGITPEMIPFDNILVDQKKKAETIKRIGAEVFYDDSPNHIVDIQRARSTFPEKFELYYVIPEQDKNLEIPSSLNLNGDDHEAYEKLYEYAGIDLSMMSAALGGGRKYKMSKKNKKRNKRKTRKSRK